MILTNNTKEISKIVSTWVDSQKDLAEKMSFTPSSLCCMLSGKVAIPLNRFLQIVHILKPPKQEVEKVFGLYLDDLEIPRENMSLWFRSWGEGNMEPSDREKLHRIVDQIDKKKLAALAPVASLMLD